ncbi:MAG: hypothetical protein J6A77_10490 [Lachnospiraceae bacterium]|nr:hypothetical protein [Lachnospiraceae bacterium]
MILKDKIPDNFYSLFRTKNREHYMKILVGLYEENNGLYTSLGLTMGQGRQIIMEIMGSQKLTWEPEWTPEEFEDFTVSEGSVLTRLLEWGWIKKDYDEKLNEYILSFPEYSQLFMELFIRLEKDDNDQERESILAVYSALYTYFQDEEKNNDILQNAIRMSRRLSQLLSNMQDGMRNYFDELSKRKNFLEIQEVLISELNNSDSKKYAILTTKDSFYRYKEAVKELVEQILGDSDKKKRQLMTERSRMQENTREYMRHSKMIECCEEAGKICYLIDKEFFVIEQKYNRLIEQKTIFAKRALARIHYILQEGNTAEDYVLKLISILDKSRNKEEILSELENRLKFTVPFYTMTGNSMYSKKAAGKPEFHPVAVKEEKTADMLEYIPKPLYTKKELQEFRYKNTKDGRFVADKDSITSVEDLEKLMFLWNEVIGEESTKVLFEGEEETDGMRFTKMVIPAVAQDETV